MRGIIGLVIVLCIGVFFGSKFLSEEAFADRGHWLAVAFTVPTGGMIQAQLGVPVSAPLNDPPETNSMGIQLWDQWIADHFMLYDAAGTRIPLMKLGTSAMFQKEVAAGAPDMVLWAEVKQGGEYKFEYRPKSYEPNRYQHTFTAPSEEVKVRRVSFELVEEKK